MAVACHETFNPHLFCGILQGVCCYKAATGWDVTARRRVQGVLWGGFVWALILIRKLRCIKPYDGIFCKLGWGKDWISTSLIKTLQTVPDRFPATYRHGLCCKTCNPPQMVLNCLTLKRIFVLGEQIQFCRGMRVQDFRHQTQRKKFLYETTSILCQRLH